MDIKTQALVAIERTKAWWQKCTQRERITVGGLIGFLVILGVYLTLEQVSVAFASQEARRIDAEQNVKKTTILLDKYSKLSAKRDTIQQLYIQLEAKEGARTLIDSLVRTKAGATSGLAITESSPKAFAGQYERFPFTIKFQTTDYPNLISFLYESIYGRQPLLVSRLEVQKNRSGDRLDVDMDVSSLRRASSEKRE